MNDFNQGNVKGSFASGERFPDEDVVA